MPEICIPIHEGSVLSLEVVDGTLGRECYIVNKHLRCLCVYVLNGGGFNCDCLCFLSSVTVRVLGNRRLVLAHT